ncbi:MAG: LicD family protein [Oscillospiraceae bacterium]|nr:LicD family protein [Oscillospiraceae bacterium]
MAQAKVSVIVPVYNVEEYLSPCLDTLVNQTLEEIEIILVNDGSPDQSQAIIDRYAAAHPEKVRPFVKPNGGLSDARNFGIEQATGEYIGFVDSDDLTVVTMFEKLYAKAVDTQSDCVVCDYSEISGNQVYKRSCVTASPLFGSNIREASALLRTAKSYAWNKLYKRSLFTQTGIRFPVGIHFEDSATIYNVLLHANKIEFVNEPLYLYRIMRPGAITTQANAGLYDIFKAMDSFLGHYKSQGVFEDHYTDLEYLCINHINARLNTAKSFPSLWDRFRFASAAYRYLNRNFPDWHNNPTYLQQGKEQVKKHGRFCWHKMRDRLFTLKLYYAFLYLLKGRDYRWSPPKSYPPISEERLGVLQEVELSILLEVDALCKRHKLSYFLAEGSLLGAIRHHDFIPWDDDMDISMPRKDFDRFMEIAARELPDHLRLCWHKTMPAYHLPFAKIISTEDYGFVNKRDKVLGKLNGIFIDIFPLDETPAPHSKELTRRFRKIRRYRDMLLYRCGYMSAGTLSRKLTRLRSKFISNKTLHRRIAKLSSKYNGKGCRYMVNFASSYPPHRQIVGKECYAPGRREEFHGHMISVPRNAEALLSITYGNFRLPPPPEKRVNKHQLVDITARDC